MFKYRFICSNENDIRSTIRQMSFNDFPCGKSIFGGDLYRSGIHFQSCDDVIKGFYLDQSEDEIHRGSPIRVSFKGYFVREDDNLVFELFIYPRIIELLLLIYVFLFVCVVGEIIGFILTTVILFFFAKGYYNMIKETYKVFDRIIK